MVKNRTLTGLLRSTTFAHVYGEKTPNGVFPSDDKKTFIVRRNRGWFADTLKNQHFQRHFQSLETFYFFGTPRIKDDYTLVMGDIDVLKSQGLGSPQGALDFVLYLKNTFYPTLYYERSTNGNGIHFYMLMRKIQAGAEAVNGSINRLQAWLKYQAELVRADIELVEVKGKAPDIMYDRNGRITKVTYGTFAKYPRNATLQDLKNTTVIDLWDLRTAKYNVPEAFEKKSTIHEGSGSTFIPDDFVREHLDSCRKTWLNLTGGARIKGGKYLVSADDAAIVKLITLWFTEHPNKNNKLSVRTILLFWQNLQDRNLTNRSPNHHRVKAIRDYLSAKRCVDWIDNGYQPPSGKGASDGICCKWRLDDGFVAFLKEGGDNVGTDFMGQGENLRPQMRMLREEEAMKEKRLFWEDAQREIRAIIHEAA